MDGEAAAMTRASGFLVGALLMLGIFLLVLSTAESPTLVQEVVSSKAASNPVVTAPVKVKAVAPVVASQVLPAAGTAGSEEENQQVTDGSGLALDPQSWNQAIAAGETNDRGDAMAMSRYRVWTPFRSEWAANGFARRLVQATAVPVEVLNESPGNYQVFFSYRDDGERRAMIKHIETVTGLELE
jgi:hypothetical protein